MAARGEGVGLDSGEFALEEGVPPQAVFDALEIAQGAVGGFVHSLQPFIHRFCVSDHEEW